MRRQNEALTPLVAACRTVDVWYFIAGWMAFTWSASSSGGRPANEDRSGGE